MTSHHDHREMSECIRREVFAEEIVRASQVPERLDPKLTGRRACIRLRLGTLI
jgi:hypothetical protein